MLTLSRRYLKMLIESVEQPQTEFEPFQGGSSDADHGLVFLC